MFLVQNLTNFSAVSKNPIATHAYIIFCSAKSATDVISIVYNIMCIGCNNTLYKYSLNHIVKACAFPSDILSIGYVTATNGAIIVKNAKYISLIRYFHVKITV